MSRLVYLIPLWSGTEQYLLKSLQVVQNKAARIVTRSGKRTPVKQLLNQCGWLSVAQLGVFHSLVLMYKILHTKSPRYLYSKLSNESTLNLRSTANNRIGLGQDSQTGAGLARNPFKYRATRQWNNLPLDVRQSINLKMFKFKLRKWVVNNGPFS